MAHPSDFHPDNHPDKDSVRGILRARGVADHIVRRGAAGLIEAWRDFVAQVERGYPQGLEDYRNDLDLRTLIEVAQIGSDVAEEDARFRRMLTGTDRAVWSSDLPGAFWVMGYPSNAAGELLADLRAESFL
jgi:hypothetical protein